MRNVLKSVLVILIMVIIGICIYMVSYYLKDKEQVDLAVNNSVETNVAPNQNENNNEVVDNNEIVNNNDNNVEENKQTEVKNDVNVEEKEPKDKVNEEVNINEEDTAIELAKKEFGITDGVYFRIEQIQSNSVYIVSVRDSETTRDLAWYTVDVKNKTVK